MTAVLSTQRKDSHQFRRIGLIVALLVFILQSMKSKNADTDALNLLSYTECCGDSLHGTVHGDEDMVVYDKVDVLPSFPGGQQNLFRFLSMNLRYPAEAAKRRIQGRVVVGFTVEKDGSITGIDISQHSTSNLLDREALRVVSKMPKWSPGRQDGRLVRVRYHLPIVFRL